MLKAGYKKEQPKLSECIKIDKIFETTPEKEEVCQK
jgi:hypothetical protein